MMQDDVIVCRKDGGIVSGAEATGSWLGYPTGFLLGSNLIDLMLDEEQACARTVLFEEDHPTASGIWTFRKHDGDSMPILIRRHGLIIPGGFQGHLLNAQRMDAISMIRALIGHPQFQSLLDRSFIGVRITELTGANLRRRTLYINEAALRNRGLTRDQHNHLEMHDEPEDILQFWEQGKEVQPGHFAQARITHYHGVLSYRRTDTKVPYIKYVTCEIAYRPEHLIRVVFEWEITDTVREQKKQRVNAATYPAIGSDGSGSSSDPLALVDIVPLPTLLLDTDANIVSLNNQARDLMRLTRRRLPIPLLNVVSHPWHVNVRTFMDHDLVKASAGRSLHCNLMQGTRNHFPACLSWRICKHEEQLFYLVVIQDLTASHLTAKVAEQAAQRERHLLKETLHDTIGQGLSALYIIISSLRLKGCLPPEVDQLLSTAEECARQALAKTRQLAHGILPSPCPANKNLLAMLEDLCLDLERIRPWRCRLDAPASLPIPMDISAALYRIIREAAENALRYSEATRLDIILRHDRNGLVATIRDNGNGLPSDHLTRGTGLATIQQIALALGGTVTIGPAVPKGVEVTCKLTLTRARAMDSRPSTARRSEPTPPSSASPA